MIIAEEDVMQQKQTRRQQIAWSWNTRSFAKGKYFDQIRKEFFKKGFLLFGSVQLDSRRYCYTYQAKAARVTTFVFYKPGQAFLCAIHFYETVMPSSDGYLCWWEMQVLSMVSYNVTTVSQLQQSFLPSCLEPIEGWPGSLVQKFRQSPNEKDNRISVGEFSVLCQMLSDWALFAESAPFDFIDVLAFTPIDFAGVGDLFRETFSRAGFVKERLLTNHQ